MSMTDPIADMLTRIRNAIMARHESVTIPSSKIKKEISRILKEEGYIEDFSIEEDGPKAFINIKLKYDKNGVPAIRGLERVSKPGRRIYSDVDNLPKVNGGLGIAIISTSRGVMVDRQSRKENVGGEVICYIW